MAMSFVVEWDVASKSFDIGLKENKLLYYCGSHQNKQYVFILQIEIRTLNDYQTNDSVIICLVVVIW